MNVIRFVNLLDLVQAVHHLSEFVLLQLAFLFDGGVQHHLTIEAFAFTQPQLFETLLEEFFLGLTLPLSRYIYTF